MKARLSITNLGVFLGIGAVLSGCGTSSPPKSRYDNIPLEDRQCHDELAKARSDIAKGRLIYCHHTGSLLYNRLRSEKELTELLSEHGVGFKEEMTSDVIMEGRTQWCYCGLMEEQIAAKFGEHFMDSLIDVSDEWFVKNAISNGDTIHYVECDVRPRYPGDDTYPDDRSDSLQADIERSLQYPPGYLKRSDHNTTAFVDLTFFVDTLGKASIIHYRSIFGMKENHRFDDHFEREIDRLARKAGWVPAMIRGRKINADMVYRFYFE